MKLIATLSLLFAIATTAACVEAHDRSPAADAIDAQTSVVEDEEAAALLAAPTAPESGSCDTVADPGAAAHAPCCGDGPVIYYDWVCTLRGWKQVVVGRQEWHCASPYFEPLQGRTASCKQSLRVECGGGNTCGCSGWSGSCARPTTPCELVPAPPPAPPTNSR